MTDCTRASLKMNTRLLQHGRLRLPRICLWATVIALTGLMGCTDTSQERIWGQYRLHVQESMKSPMIEHVRPDVRASLNGLSNALSDALVYEFSADGCAYLRGDKRTPFECEYVRTEKSEVVVLRSVDHRGLTSYLRLRPTEHGIELNRLDQTIALKRIAQ